MVSFIIELHTIQITLRPSAPQHNKLKEKEKMKKWLAACLLAIALLFVTTAAMAGHIKANGEYCLGGSYGLLKEYEKQHLLRCNDCQEEILEDHFVGNADSASCIVKKQCGSCTKYLGDGDHNWGDWEPNGDGTHTRTCTRNCKLNNRTETEECTFSVAPCTAPAACTVCGGVYSTEHDWGGWTPNGDQTHTRVCTRDSSHTDTKDCTDFWDADCTTPTMCGVCWGTYGETDPDGHDWERPRSNGDGTHTYTCFYNSNHTKKEACTTSGPFHGEMDWCDKCGEATVSHNFDDNWRSDAEGHWKTCLDCEESQTKVPHSFVEQVDEKHLKSEATCVSVAVYYRSCSVCGHHATDTFESGDINPNNHDLVRREAKDPTCTEEGWTVHEACRREGCRYTTPHYRISHSGHSLIPHNGKTPTCTEKGWSAYDTCKREGCNYTSYQGLDALDHDWEWVSNGNGTHTRTCKNDPGHTETEACSGVGCGQTGACSVCKGEYTAADHKYETWLYDSYEHWSYCIYCSEERRSSHSFSEHKQSEATCVSPAKYLGTCSDCGFYRTYDRGDIDPNNHDLIHHEAKTATCTEIGWEAYDTCSRCDYTTYQEIPAPGHDYAEEVVKPTCEKDGYTLHTCKKCNDSYKDHWTQKRMHWYGEWTNNGDGTHSAACKREGCNHVGKTQCAIVEFRQEEAAFTLCPICGNVSDGTHLALVEEVTAEGEHLPYGELVLRMGETANGNTLLSVCFEVSGKLTRPKGEVKITLPAELLNGVTLTLLNADDTEIDLPYIVEGENAAFTLDFTDAALPTALIRLIPTAE